MFRGPALRIDSQESEGRLALRHGFGYTLLWQMHELNPPDSHYLNAALGWLELGSWQEAKGEWAGISPENRNHPGVLEVSWQIHAMQRDWAEALEIAARLLELTPESPAGWICHSYTLHEMKRTQEAFESLLPIVNRFSSDATIPYNLACYACQLGHLKEAREWLRRAIKIKSKFRKVALQDPDLRPMWDQVKAL